MRELLPPHLQDAAQELAPYLGDAFGNQTRIDYGTGHETTFVLWLCCLFKASPRAVPAASPPSAVAVTRAPTPTSSDCCRRPT